MYKKAAEVQSSKKHGAFLYILHPASTNINILHMVTRYIILSCSVMSDSLYLVDCSLPGSSDHGIFQARILEWVAVSYSRGSSRPRDRTGVSFVSCIDRWVPGMMFTASRFPQCPGAHAESAGYARSVQLGRWQLRFPDSRSWVSRFDPSSLGKDPFRSGLFRLAPAL